MEITSDDCIENDNDNNNKNIPKRTLLKRTSLKRTLLRPTLLKPKQINKFLQNRIYYINGIIKNKKNKFLKLDWENLYCEKKGIKCKICQSNNTFGKYVTEPASSISKSKCFNHFQSRKHNLSRKFFMYKNGIAEDEFSSEGRSDSSDSEGDYPETKGKLGTTEEKYNILNINVNSNNDIINNNEVNKIHNEINNDEWIIGHVPTQYDVCNFLIL